MLGAKNGVGMSGPSLGLTIAGLAFRYSTWHIPDDFVCKLEAAASMFNDTVVGSHVHCLYIGHLPLLDFTLAHWTAAMS